MKEKKIGIAFAANTNKFIPEAVRRDPASMESGGGAKDSKGLTVSYFPISIQFLLMLM